MQMTKSSSGSGPRWAADSSITHLGRLDRDAAETRRDPTAQADADPNWLGHQLLEASVVNVPANPDALLEAPMLELRSDAAKRQRMLEVIKLKAWC